jgi:hypothetical protein
MSTERERKLYEIGSTGLPIGQSFFDEFPDTNEVLPLALSLAVRRLVTIVCDKDVADKDFIPAARLIFQLNGKDVGLGDEGSSLAGSAERTAHELQQALERTKSSSA